MRRLKQRQVHTRELDAVCQHYEFKTRQEMADIRRVTDTYAVAPQIDEDDFAEIAATGYKLVINNRPDGESFDQMTSETAEKCAALTGLTYASVPVSGAPTMDAVDATVKLIKDANAPIFAYCRSGTRSVTLWTLATVKAGLETPENAVEKARNAGYDLSHLQEMLQELACAD